MARQAGHPGVDRGGRQRRRARVVRVADDHHPRGRGDLAGHRLEVVLPGVVQGDRDRPGAGHGGQVRVDRERRPGVHHLRAGLEHRLGRREQQLAGAVADGDAPDRHAGPLGDAAAEARTSRGPDSGSGCAAGPRPPPAPAGAAGTGVSLEASLTSSPSNAYVEAAG